MSDAEKILILLATADAHLAHQLVQRIRTQFSRLPIEVSWISDGKQARAEFANQKPTLIIISQDLPNLSGHELIQEIRKEDGSVCILFLQKPDESPVQGVDCIGLPIVNWTEFMARIQDAIPDFWKAKFGIFASKSPLFRKLSEYGQGYKQTTDDRRNSQPLVCIPNLYDLGSGALTLAQPPNKLESRSAEVEIFRNSPALFMRSLKIELAIVALLTLACLSTLKWQVLSSSESFWSLRSVLIVITGFSYLGFFLGRIFDRFAISKGPGKKPSP